MKGMSRMRDKSKVSKSQPSDFDQFGGADLYDEGTNSHRRAAKEVMNSEKTNQRLSP